MKKKVCPFVGSYCGGLQSHNLEINQTANHTINITDLPEGRTCIYKIHSSCGNVRTSHEAVRYLRPQERENEIDWDEYPPMNATTSVQRPSQP